MLFITWQKDTDIEPSLFLKDKNLSEKHNIGKSIDKMNYHPCGRPYGRINTCLLSVGHHKLNRGQNQLSFDDVIIKIFSVLFNSIFSSLNYTCMLYKSFSSHITSLNREPGAREALTSIFRMSAQIASSILMNSYQ